jgi:hypothetical protein
MILTRSYRDSGPSFFSRHGHATFFVMTAVSLAAVLLVGAIRRTG